MAEAANDDRILTVSRVIAAPPEKLFEAFIVPEVMLKWWGPEGASVADHALDIRVGGSWRTALANSMGQDRAVCSGVYMAIDRPRRIAFTWAWQQPDGSRGAETLVDVSFERIDRGTRLTVTQKSFESVELRDRHGEGWNSALNNLERLFV